MRKKSKMSEWCRGGTIRREGAVGGGGGGGGGGVWSRSFVDAHGQYLGAADGRMQSRYYIYIKPTLRSWQYARILASLRSDLEKDSYVTI